MSHERYRSCIEACQTCAMYCDHCAAACLQEEDVKRMARCIRLDLDCSETCRLAVALMARGSEFAQRFCALCAEVCAACAEECGKHSHRHCQECAEHCRRCAAECRKMAA